MRYHVCEQETVKQLALLKLMASPNNFDVPIQSIEATGSFNCSYLFECLRISYDSATCWHGVFERASEARGDAHLQSSLCVLMQILWTERGKKEWISRVITSSPALVQLHLRSSLKDRPFPHLALQMRNATLLPRCCVPSRQEHPNHPRSLSI